MNLLNKKMYKYKGEKIFYKKKKSFFEIYNNGNTYGFYIIPKIIKAKNDFFEIYYEGQSIEGLSANLCVFNLKKQLIGELSLNSKNAINVNKEDNYIFAIKVFPHSSVKIKKIVLEESLKTEDDFMFENIDNDNKILVITPSYPSLENKYLCGFVHSRLKSYKDHGINFDVVCCHNYNGICKYNYEGIDVLRVNFSNLRHILQHKKYDKILVHFFDDLYAKVFDACYLDETELYLWVHGPETLYWDWSKFTTEYFKNEQPLSYDLINKFKNNDEIIRNYNEKSNVHWIFVSNWIKQRSEELINIKFKNYDVIPNIIDSETFKYVEKNPEQRKNVFFIRRFDDCNKYAIDLNVRAILELSKRKCFENMNFNIYGTGDTYDKLIEPLLKFKNVHFYREFLTHEEIAKKHKENGIAFFPTRYDAQGVSMCEAAMSGLAVVTSDNDAVKEFLPKDKIYANTENYVEYADIIENLYNNPELFKKISKDCHDSVYNKCNFNETTGKEIELFKQTKKLDITKKKIIKEKQPVLSIVIPCYNVEKYIEKTISTIVTCKNADKIEIIPVNDGSKDNTAKIINRLINEYSKDKKTSIFNFIDKENGGHGSTINAGLKVATGKYFRVIDGDDWINSQEMDKLIDKLENETSDIVITDYSEDLAFSNILNHKKIYDFMIPNIKYDFEDLCIPNYGFGEWGPILATGNYKTEVLKKTNFKLSEKSFYVDMEYNVYSIEKAKTITYYPYDIYRYFIGRSGQSVSKKSFIKNRFQHEKVLLNMITYVENNKNISELKKQYIYEKLINPMANAHYIILTEYQKKPSEFKAFDKLLKSHPEVYYSKILTRKFIRLNRKTNGLILPISPLIIKLYKFVRR